MTQLSLFSESELDSPCRTCLFSNWDVAYVIIGRQIPN